MTTKRQPTLTPRQVEILTYIRDCRKEWGYSPTLKEIAHELNISAVTVFEHVEHLEEKGLVTKLRNKARSLQLTRKALGLIRDLLDGAVKDG